MLNELKQRTLPVSGLEKVAPGFYVDRFGGQYFYLTGVYGSITKRLMEKPGLNTTAFVVVVLDELRQELMDRYYLELMD